MLRFTLIVVTTFSIIVTGGEFTPPCGNYEISDPRAFMYKSIFTPAWHYSLIMPVNGGTCTMNGTFSMESERKVKVTQESSSPRQCGAKCQSPNIERDGWNTVTVEGCGGAYGIMSYVKGSRTALKCPTPPTLPPPSRRPDCGIYTDGGSYGYQHVLDLMTSKNYTLLMPLNGASCKMWGTYTLREAGNFTEIVVLQSEASKKDRCGDGCQHLQLHFVPKWNATVVTGCGSEDVYMSLKPRSASRC